MTILLSFWSNKSILTSAQQTPFFLKNCKILPTSKTVSLHVKGVCVFGHIWLLFVPQCKYWKKAHDMQCESERYHLYKYWARFFCFYKEQPLNLIKWGHGTHNACKNQIWRRCRLQDYLFKEKDFHFLVQHSKPYCVTFPVCILS